MTLFFPPLLPLRTHFDADVKRPSIVAIYKPDKRGKLKLVRAVLPARSVR